MTDPKFRDFSYPGGVIVNGVLEYYVDTVFQEISMKDVDSSQKRMFIVIWCGWPNEYATIEPIENLENSTALIHFELARQGKLSGTSAGKSSTAIRTTKRKILSMEKNYESKIWMNKNIKRLFQMEEDMENFHPLVGMIGNLRTEIFWKEYNFLKSVCKMQSNFSSGYFLSDRIWGSKNQFFLTPQITESVLHQHKTIDKRKSQSHRSSKIGTFRRIRRS